MKKIYKIFIDQKEEHNLTKKDVIALQNIFRGDITQIGLSKDLCKNCESSNAGEDYCNDCKSQDKNLFAMKHD